MIALPVIVGFEIEPNPVLLFFECISFLAYSLYILIGMRTPFYHQGVLVDEPRKVFEEYFYSKKFICDALTALPINLIVWNFVNVRI
jgi:hypothetical protein